MEDRLTLLTEFPIDNERLKREMAIAKKEIEGGGDAAVQAAARVNKGISDMVGSQDKGVRQLEKSILDLQIRMQSYQGVVAKSTDPSVIIEYNRRIQQTQMEITRLRNVGKAGFDEMGNAIQKNIVWNNGLVRGLSRTVEHLRRLAYIIPGLGISGLFFLAWEPLSKFVKKLWEARKNVDELAKSQQTLNKAFESNEYAKAVTAVNELRINLDLAKKGMADKKAVIDQYNKSVGAAAGEVTTLSGVEQGLIDNADNYVKMMLYKAAATAALEEASKHAVAAAKALAQTDDEAVPYILSGTQGMVNSNTGESMHERAAENARNRQAAAEQKHVDTMLTIAEKFQKDAAKIAGEMGGLFLRATDPKSQKEMDRILRDRQRLLDRLATMETEYLRKSLTKDQEELQALRDKFAKIRTEVERFNADPKNKHVKIDIAGLADIEDRAIADLTYRQETDKLKTQLERQRDLWQQYEEYKTATSEEHANERYAHELEKIRTFRADLEREVSALAMKQITEGLTGGEAERLIAFDALLRDIENKEQAERDARFTEAYNATLSYEQRRQKIIADSEQKISALQDVAAKERARKKRDQDLVDLDVEYLKSLESIQVVFEDIDYMSTSAARKAVRSARDTFEAFIKEGDKAGKHVDALRKIFDRFFNETEDGLTQRAVTGWQAISSELSDIANTLGDIDEDTGKWMGTIANAIGNVGRLKSALVDMREAQETGDTMAGVTSFMGAYGAILSTVGGIFSGVYNSIVARQEAAFAYQQEQQRKQAEALTKVLEYQLRVVNDLYGTERIQKYQQVIDEIAQAERDLSEAIRGRLLNVGHEFTDNLIADINRGKTSIEDIERNIIQLRRQADNMVVQSGSDAAMRTNLYDRAYQLEQALTRINSTIRLTGSETTEELKRLYSELDEETIAAIERMDEFQTQFKDVIEQLKEELTGTTFSGILDDLIAQLERGEIRISDFAESFEKHMQRALIQSFRRDHLAQAMQPYFDSLAELMRDSTPEEADIERLRKMYESIGLEAAEQWKRIEEITGQSLTTPENAQGISGRINRTISESTASEILGFERARYDLHKRSLGNAEETLRVEKQLYDATLQSLRHHAAIEQNTADTVTELRSAVVELKAINKNTKQSSTSYDRP